MSRSTNKETNGITASNVNAITDPLFSRQINEIELETQRVQWLDAPSATRSTFSDLSISKADSDTQIRSGVKTLLNVYLPCPETRCQSPGIGDSHLLLVLVPVKHFDDKLFDRRENLST